MLKLLAIAAVASLCIIAAVHAQQSIDDGPCLEAESIAACAAKSASPTPTLCVWSDEKGCIQDRCRFISNNVTCKNTPGCVAMPWSSGATCFGAALLCSNLGTDYCTKYPFCTVRDQTYCAVIGILSANTVKAECDVNFPKWSVALIFVWLIIMVILALIIALAMGKAKQQKVTGVEQDGDLVVESVQIRDTFQLGEPLTQSNDE